jgi:hypothetical protein
MQILLVGASFGVVRPARAGPRVWKQFGASVATTQPPHRESPLFDMSSARHDTNAKGGERAIAVQYHRQVGSAFLSPDGGSPKFVQGQECCQQMAGIFRSPHAFFSPNTIVESNVSLLGYSLYHP